MVEENTSTVDSTPLSVEDIRKNYLTKRLFKWWMERPLAIYKVFQHMYGAENVDMNVLKPIGKYNTFVDTWYNVVPSSIIKVDEPSDPTILHNYKHPVWAIPTLQEYEDLLSYIFSCENQELVTRGNYMSTDYCCYITVHFPKLTITNENGNSIDITHLWVVICINALGKMICNEIAMNRSEYTNAQFETGYCHSHLPRLRQSQPEKFERFCFGDSPAAKTINTLCHTYDLTLWQLFCIELQTSLQVESLSGGPYLQMSEVTNSPLKAYAPLFSCATSFSYLPGHDKYNDSTYYIDYRDFVTYLIKNRRLNLFFNGRAFTSADNYLSYIVNLSKDFITWYNKRYKEGKEILTLTKLLEYDVLFPCVFKGGTLYAINSSAYKCNAPDPDTIRILSFKGKDVYLHVIENNLPEDYNISYLLTFDVAIRILIIILQILNYRYDTTIDSPSITLGEPGVKVKYFRTI